MGIVDFEASKTDYEQAFMGLRDVYQLPDRWFRHPDHVAIKCADTPSYLDAIELFAPLVEGDSYGKIEQGGRRLASGELNDPIQLAGFVFEMIEIMEPRPNAIQIDRSFVEHTEFTVEDLLAVYNGLTQRISPSDQEVRVVDDRGSHHPGIVVEFGDGLEVKFNETSLADMVADEQKRKIWERIK